MHSPLKYYERYLFYGDHANAFADHNWEKGARGVPKREFDTNAEYGARRSSERTGSKGKVKRQQFPDYLNRLLDAFVKKHAHVPGMRLIAAARKFITTRVGWNGSGDGTSQSHPVDRRKLPSDEEVARKMRPLWRAEKARLAVLKASEAGKGYSAQIAKGDLNVIDIDGTVADCFLRVGKTVVGLDDVLKPTVMLAIDRASRAIVGWCVTYRHENADCYLSTVFSACIDKEDELERWGVQHLDGMVFGCPSTVFVGRGPGISEKVVKLVVEGLKSRLLMAEPGNPRGKGDVEQLMVDSVNQNVRFTDNHLGRSAR